MNQLRCTIKWPRKYVVRSLKVRPRKANAFHQQST